MTCIECIACFRLDREKHYGPITAVLLLRLFFRFIYLAKIRLSNIKLDEIVQVMRNKSKWIKS